MTSGGSLGARRSPRTNRHHPTSTKGNTMSETTAKKTAAAPKTKAGEEPANVVPHAGDHDRIQMASVRADGTLDQHNPEFIGDKETAIAATKEQFATQAVSAADVARAAAAAATDVEGAEQDPSIAEATAEHEAAAAAAEKAAESVVNELHQG